ncbi:DUF1579 family protein [Bacillus sp. FJAT-49705]|uniref:DUF1579 family protein n=1 Tax=Cytobacillus citreus TaxID=2833586 RepID=A0ABS5NZA1_9BACI|nr:DUF1579 family protein [Cytobacillus citreus]MBS4192921.1 DUF1579 family protein [Cytobacillus citreus]
MTKNDKVQAVRPGPEHKLLDIFVGKWKTEGQIKATSSSPAARLTAVDTYEWLPGGFFLIHYVDARMGDMEVKTTEIIGYDASSQTYFTSSFDNQGNTGTYQANLREGAWTINGKTERFTGEFSDGGNILKGKWEMSSDGSNWEPWMDIKLTKEL